MMMAVVVNRLLMSFLSILFFMVVATPRSASSAFAFAPRSGGGGGSSSIVSSSMTSKTKTKTTTTRQYLYASVEAAIADAQRVCATEGQGSQACVVAWDIVEELEAADSHKNSPKQIPNAAPDYVALMGSFDILAAKIDGKMEQLKATTQKFHELGATDTSIGLEELYNRAEEMQQLLNHAKESLRQ